MSKKQYDLKKAERVMDLLMGLASGLFMFVMLGAREYAGTRSRFHITDDIDVHIQNVLLMIMGIALWTRTIFRWYKD